MRLALAFLLLAACDDAAAPPAPAANEAPAPAPAASEGSAAPELQVTLSAAHTPLRQIAAMLSEQLGQSVVIGSRVEPVADCLRLSILNAGPEPASRVVDQIRRGLAQSGVALEVDAAELRFVAVEGSEPSCPRPSEPEPSDEPAAPQIVVDGIHEVSSTEWTVRRSAVEAMHGPEVARLLRVIPHEEGGEVVGLKVYGVRRSSSFGLLGIQNGDLVRSINGRPLGNPSAAIDAYTSLRTDDEFVVELERRGEPRTHTYRVIP